MAAVPTRAEFFSDYSGNGKTIITETHNVFGWKIQKHVMPVGASLVMVATQDVLRARSPNRAMYVKGRCTVTNENGTFPDRVPGMFSAERPDHPGGKTVVTAVEETEFWCANYLVNRRALPDLTPVRLAAGETGWFDAGTLLFVMTGTAGDIVGPCTYDTSAEFEITADTPLFAFKIGAPR